MLRFEAWTVPWDSSGFKRIIADIPVEKGQGMLRHNDFGEGQIAIPAFYSRLSSIISSTTGRLIRVYYGSTLVQEFLAERVERRVEDETDVVMVSGGDLSTAFDRAILYPHDYPTNPSQFADWVYGGSNALYSSGFENSNLDPEVYELWNDRAGGTFTADFGGTATASLAEDISASALETALEGLSELTDCLVTGSGTQTDPWRIEMVTPGFGLTLNITDTTITSTLDQINAGSLQPSGWTKSQTVSTGVPHLHGTYASNGFYVDTTHALSGTYALYVNGLTQYAGAQQIVNVKPGGTYQVKVPVWTADSADLFRVVVRDINEGYIAASSPFTGSTTGSVSNWDSSTFVISDLTIPDGVTQVILRFAYVGTGNPNPFWIDDVEFNLGASASTVGTIVNEMMDDATSDHSSDTRGTILTWVDYSGFSASVDSSSDTWDESLSITLQRGMKYGQVFDKFRDLGYEWNLTAKSGTASYAAGADTHNLNWYNQANLGTSYAASATPAINVGQSIESGPVVQRIPDYTAVLVEGAGQNYTEDKDSTAETNFGRFEKYFGDKRWTDSTTRTAAGDAALSEESDNRIAVKVRVVDNPNHPTPLVDYLAGDTLMWQVPPVLTQSARQVQSIVWRYNTEDGVIWDVTGSKVFPGETGGWEALRVLLRKFAALEFEATPVDNSSIGGGGGGMAHVLIVSDSEPADIQDKADYVIPQNNSSTKLQAAFDDIDTRANGSVWTVWIAGQFDLDSNVSAPSPSWIRGLGYTTAAGV